MQRYQFQWRNEKGIFLVLLFGHKATRRIIGITGHQIFLAPGIMLRIILTFILIYLIFRVLTAYVFPWLVRWYLKRFQKRFYRDNPWFAEQQGRKRQGEDEVHIKGKPPKSKKEDLGEYVDFEEIKEDKKDKEPKAKK